MEVIGLTEALRCGAATLVESRRVRREAREIRGVSRWLAAHARVARSRRKPIAGGADPAGPTDVEIRQRIRQMLQGNGYSQQDPTVVWVGVSDGQEPCSACGGRFARGAARYLIRTPPAGLLLDDRCFALYTVEVMRG